MDPTQKTASAPRIEDATHETLPGWLAVHNILIPNAPLTLADARQRLRRHRLLVAITANDVVGTTTVRPPTADTSEAMVIARVLPEHQGTGLGQRLYESALAQALDFAPDRIRTCVLATSKRGLDFATRNGFVEVERYVLNDDDVAFVELVREAPPPPRTAGPAAGLASTTIATNVEEC